MTPATTTRIGGSFATDDDRWAAVLAHDTASDGVFFYGVRTTGVYCRPTCPSRRPRRATVSFFATAREAERAGFRACKRCRPADPNLAVSHADVIARACRSLADAGASPTLDALAAAAGMSRFHFHRTFKALTGTTPKAYSTACRAMRLREGLPRSATVTGAIYGSGFQSNGRFYATSSASLGMTASAFRGGGDGIKIRFALGECSLGSILVAATVRGICSIMLGDSPEVLLRDLQSRFAKADLAGDDPEFEQWVAQVVGMVEAPAAGLALPLDLRGTIFQSRVWQALREIPCGSTLSYSELAERIGNPKGVRAVARACAANEIAVAIPCHRVVRKDGNLADYRWGIDRKRALLAREAAQRAFAER